MKQLYVKTRYEWRQWLFKHHQIETEVWLVFFKKATGTPTIAYESAVEEALCFGWIDSIIKKLDDEKYARKFTPRKPNSRWSDLNKKRVKKMLGQGRMTKFGLAKVQQAKQDGLWNKPDRLSVAFDIPEEFAHALKQNKKAQEFFDQLASTFQKQYIGWITLAKRKETRAKRTKESIALLSRGAKLGLK
jgi:uncharacterized protein YdeI (YjbR/CyaY-like superfamily)